MGDVIRPSGTNCPSGCVDGDHTQLDGKHEPELEPRLGTDGTGDTEALERDDCSLRVSEVIERFRQQTRIRLKDDTAEQYAHAFRRFAKNVDIESYTRRQLAGPQGRMLILTHLDMVPRTSWRWILVALKPMWTYGMNLAWPIDNKRDLPRLPNAKPGHSPPDSEVKMWAKAISNERDTYLRLIFLFIADHGWRLSHVCRMRWRNVQYDHQEKPVAIVADGMQESFKTNSPVAARLCPEVVEAMIRWKEEIGIVSSDQPILPWRSAKGRLVRSRVQKSDELAVHWRRLEKKYRLLHLQPRHFRHWTATISRRAGLSKQASAFLMGHDATQGGAMRDYYDRPQLQDVFDEQADRLPYGPLGFLDPPTVELEGGLSKEVVSLVSAYLAGHAGTMEFASAMEKIRLQRSTQQATVMEP
jgi:integrase